MDTSAHLDTVGVTFVIFNLSFNGPSLEAIIFSDDRNEKVMIANLSLDESSFEVVVLIDDGSGNSNESTEIGEE